MTRPLDLHPDRLFPSDPATRGIARLLDGDMADLSIVRLEDMRRCREMTAETASFYKTVGCNDDMRAFISIPARRDVARRIDCGFLAQRVGEHRLVDCEAAELAQEFTSGLVRHAYHFDPPEIPAHAA